MINRIIINGFLGKNPEVRKTLSGKSVCNFSIAQTFKDKDGNENTQWYFINAWDKTADFLGMYCHVGDMILVDGHMIYRTWEKDGQRRTANEIVADSITLERKKHTSVQTEQPRQYTQQTYTQPQQTYAQPAYSQQSMMSGANVQAQVDDFGINNGIAIDASDLPF